MKNLLVLGCAICTLFVGVTAHSDDSATVQLTGKVLNSENQPVSGATAEIYQPASIPSPTHDLDLKERATTDSAGVFHAQIARNQAVILVRQVGFAPAWLSLYNLNSDVDQQLVLTAPTNFVGVVTDETGKPVPDADVSVAYAMVESPAGDNRRSYSWLSGKLAKESFSARTGTDGRFEIRGFPTNAGAFLVASAPGKVMARREIPNLGPDTLTRPDGKEIKLELAPAGKIEGRLAVESGEPVAKASIWLQPQQGGFMPNPEPVETTSDGTFTFSTVPPGGFRVQARIGTNVPPDWVASSVPVSVESGATIRDVKLVASRGGVLEVTVLDENRKPLAGAGVNAYREMEGQGASSSEAGVAVLRLLAGQYNVSAYKENLRAANTTAVIETGATNRVEIQFQPRPKIAGTILDPSGKAAAKISLTIFPNWGGPSDGTAKSDDAGHYELFWDPRQYGGGMDRTFCLIARDTEKNLATAEDIDEETRSKDIRLQPGLSVRGRVEDAQGRPLTNASISFTLWAGNMGSSFGEQPKTDADGRFRATSLPAGRRYTVQASANGYGSSNQQLQEPEGGTNAVELPIFVLKLADRELAGQVLDPDDKPAAGANVNIQGEGQPFVSIVTDKDGRFAAKVCEGMVRVFAHAQNSYSNASVESGDTNVVLQLHSYSMPEREMPKRVSLKGRPLPDLAPLGFSPDAVPAGPVLLCLFDSEQRPSRRFVRAIAEQHDQLVQKKVTVLGAQATVIAADALQEWRESNSLPFPIGRIAEKTPALKWITDVDSLPWLILTDAEHKIVEEGFELDELGDKVQALSKPAEK